MPGVLRLVILTGMSKAKKNGCSPLAGLGEGLRKIRKERRISQENLALDAGLSRAYVGKLEASMVNASVITLSKICRVLGVKISELFIRGKL